VHEVRAAGGIRVTYSVELIRTETYGASIDANSRQHAARILRERVTDQLLEPDTIDTQIEALAVTTCDACAMTEQDAHLMAAAPNLLAVVLAARDAFHHCYEDVAGTPTEQAFLALVEMCEKAIAAAAGKQAL